MKNIFRSAVAAGAVIIAASAVSITAYAAPTSYSSVDEGYITSVKNQGQWGICWQFAGVAASEASLIKEFPEQFNSQTLDLSENIQAYMVSHPNLYGYKGLSADIATYNEISSYYLNSGGNGFDSGLAFMSGYGPYAESDAFPYTPYATPSIVDYSFTESEYYALRDSGIAKGTGMYTATFNQNNNDAVKQMIMDYGAAVIVYNDQSSCLSSDADGNYYYYCPTAYSTNHVVTIVGWDDTIPASAFKTEPEGDGAWLIKNSWGSNSRDGGYFWLSYYDKTVYNVAMTYDFTVAGEDDYYNYCYSYDTSNTSKYVYWSGLDTAYSANIFTAQDKHIITGAAFYATEGSTVEVSVYKGVKENEPNSGTLMTTKKVSATFGGYNSCTFDDEVTVEEGDAFSIVVKATTPSDVPVRVYIENNYDKLGYTRSATITSGQSFYSAGGVFWTDTISKGGNVMIKAYATVADCTHNYGGWITDEEATCTTAGSKHRICQNCGKKETSTINKTGHTYKTTVVQPTSQEQGYTLFTCTKCYYSYKTNYKDKLTLSAVTGLTLTPTSSTSVTLSWDKNENATGYFIQQYKDGEWTHIRQLARNTVTSYTATGLLPFTNYNFRIRAYYTSDDTTVYTDYTTISGTTKSSNMTGVTATSTANTVTLSWNKNDAATGYFIQQYKNGVWTHVRQLARNTVLSYTATGLTPSTTYQYRIRAYYTSGDTTVYSDYKYVSPTTRPSNLTGVKATSTANTVTLSWNKNDTATGYFIQQYKDGKWTHVRQLARNTVLSYTATGLTPSTTYKFRIRAYYTNGTSTTYSDYKYVSPTTRPSNMTGVKVTSTSNTVTLSWNKNDTATGYFIQQYKNGEWTHIRQLARNTVLSYTATGLDSSTTYQFRIRAYYTNGSTTTNSDYTTISVKTTS